MHGFQFTSAVAAHHGPSPAFQTIILDRACPGSVLKNSDTQVVARKRVSRVSRNAPFWPRKQAHTHSPFRAIFQPPFFCFDGYGLTLSGNNELVEFRPKPAFLQPCHLPRKLFGREMAKIQPPLTHLTPNSFIFMLKEIFMTVTC